MDVTINDDCTLEAAIGGVYGQPDPVTVNATYRDGTNSTIVDIVGDPVFGNTTITVTNTGALTVAGTGLHQGIDSVNATGTVTTTEISLEVTLSFQGGGMTTETVELTRDVPETPTPTDTPSPTVTPAPTGTPTPTATPAPTSPTPIAWARLWGDVDCSNLIDPIDSLKLLRGDAGLDVSYQTPDCPQIGAAIPAAVPVTPWGDIDCSGQVNPVDSLKTLRYDAGLSVDQPAGCPQIASPF